jgi:phenylacetate-CoA ligase
VIVGFGMGVWIGGLITYKAFEIAAKRLGHPVSIITPGINKQEIFHALRELAPQFKETII